MNGILVIDKPRGWTSHDVVNKARRVLRERRIGHTGTLDPLATGVLVLCIGQATRLVRYLEADDKEYTAEMRLGILTDTQDADGRPVAQRAYQAPGRDAIEAVLNAFRGELLQVPPAYSALKVNGVPSYRLARAGKEPRHRERPVTIHAIALLSYEEPLVRFRVHCSKGTYIRTLCADIGERLGPGGHLTALRRERSGLFSIGQAKSMEHLEQIAASGGGQGILVPMDEALQAMPSVALSPDDARRIAHGNPCTCTAVVRCPADGERVRILDSEGKLLGVAVGRMGMLHPETVLA
jgi:tRNA pseudouridine55 synthase